MTDLATARRQLVMANRILANEGILDAFGHVTVRHPENTDRFLMAWARAPELIEDADLLELLLPEGGEHGHDRVAVLARVRDVAGKELRVAVRRVLPGGLGGCDETWRVLRCQPAQQVRRDDGTVHVRPLSAAADGDSLRGAPDYLQELVLAGAVFCSK